MYGLSAHVLSRCTLYLLPMQKDAAAIGAIDDVSNTKNQKPNTQKCPSSKK
jgi:hypothetical protein